MDVSICYPGFNEQEVERYPMMVGSSLEQIGREVDRVLLAIDCLFECDLRITYEPLNDACVVEVLKQKLNRR